MKNQEAIEYYRNYQKNKDLHKFSAFVESLRTEKDTAVIEAIQKAINTVILEGVKDPMSGYYKQIVDAGKFLQDNKELIEKASKNPTDPKNADILLKSVYPTIANATDKWVEGTWAASEAKGREFGVNTGETVFGELLTYVKEKLIPAYDPNSAKFNTYVTGAINFIAKEFARNELGIENITKNWNPDTEYRTYPKTNTDSGEKYMYADKVLYNGAVFKRIGDEVIPEEDRKFPPSSSEGRRYWETYKSPGAFTTSKIVTGEDETEGQGLGTPESDLSKNEDDKEEKMMQKPEKDVENVFVRPFQIIDSLNIPDNGKAFLKELIEMKTNKVGDANFRFNQGDLQEKHGITSAMQSKTYFDKFKEAFSKEKGIKA